MSLFVTTVISLGSAVTRF